MEATLVTAGLLCLVAAIVGGGLKAWGAEMPVVQSTWRQAMLGVIGLALIALAIVLRWPPGEEDSASKGNAAAADSIDTSRGGPVSQHREVPSAEPIPSRSEMSPRQQNDGAVAPAPSQAATMLGLDLDGYCKQTFGLDAHAHLNDFNDAYSWRCLDGDLPRQMIIQDACERQYGSQSRAVLGSKLDAYSWACR